MTSLNTKTSYSILDFVKDVLKKRFSDTPIKQEVLDEDPDKLNFACPYCGDSKKDPNKKRGNLWLVTNTYKCFNDGCMKWTPANKFISHFAQKYSLPIPSLKNDAKKIELGSETKRKSFLIEFLLNQEKNEKLLNFGDIVQRFGLIPCSQAPKESPIHAFIERRGLATLPMFEKTCFYDSREDKVYIFNLDLRSGKVLGFAIRRIDDSWMGPKYDIVNYSHLNKNGLISEDDSFNRQVDAINNYFNILNVNFAEPVLISEGQFDSMFLKNSIATTGVSKSKALLDFIKNGWIVFDNDKAGKEQSMILLRKGYRVFLWTKILYSLKKKYPKQLRDILKIKDINDLYVFLLKNEPDMNYEKFNNLITQNFSNSPFDIILV